MSTHEDFPAELVEARANELRAAYFGASCGRVEDANPSAQADWRGLARLSLRREVEACEPLVEALSVAASVIPRGTYDSFCHRGLMPKEDCRRCRQAEVVHTALAAHRARYAPKPETLADVAREAAEALSGNAALSARLLAAVEREKGGAK